MSIILTIFHKLFSALFFIEAVTDRDECLSFVRFHNLFENLSLSGVSGDLVRTEDLQLFILKHL